MPRIFFIALLPLLAGLAAALGFAPFDLWPVALLGIALLVALTVRATGLRQAFAVGWWFGVGNFALGFDWIATAFTYQAAMPPVLGWAAVIGLAMFLGSYPGLATLAAVALGRSPAARTLLLAAAFMLTEWLRGVLFSGFAWNPLGSLWVPLPGVAAAAAVIGALGLSGLSIVAGGALAAAARRDWWLAGLLPLAIAGGVAWERMRPALPPGPPAPRLALVQANIGEGAAFADPVANLQSYLALTRAAFAADPQPGVAIWPEGSVAWPVEDDPQVRAALASVVPPGGLLLFGGDSIIRDGSGRAIAATNSLFALDHHGAILARYDKAHLVPGGEYLPLRRLTEPLGLARVVPGSLDFREGPGPRTLRLPGLPPVGAAICYEIIFGGAVIDRADRPAWILTISNDAWFGTSGPPQHWAQARLRAIEEGLPVVRSTPTGITGIIDARGGVVAALPAHVEAVLHATIPAALPPTPFARFGHLTSLLFGLLLAAAGVVLDRRT